MSRKHIWTALLLAVCLLAVPGAALAGPALAPLADDTVIFGNNFTLAAGEVTDNLVVFGGNVTVEEGATVLQNLVVFGGNVSVHGHVGESVVTVGGNIDLGPTAVVQEDLVNFGGHVTRQPGAQVLGYQSTEGQLLNPEQIRVRSGPSWLGTQVLRVFQLVGLLGVAFVLALLTPRQLTNTANTIARRGVAAGGLGAISYILLPVAVVITLITCILPPLILLLVLLGTLFGWAALGLQLGRRLAEMFKAHWSFEVQVLAGNLALALVAFAVRGVPCIGWLGTFALGSIGLGAALLSRFGTEAEPLDEDLPPALPAPLAAAATAAAKPAAKPVAKPAKARASKAQTPAPAKRPRKPKTSGE
ncbi:MAG: hypothetical protein KIT46_03155 [Anaerolineales bacterium]|nr:hypothetical protein [Anaerolineales bacterium]MCW5855024.1 hypothetical protein [Anaerolineales bacterium]